MAAVNLFKLALLLVGFIGYLTGSQEMSEEIRSVDHHRDKRNIYLNSKAPILIAAYITIPLSVAFPSLKGRSARSDAEYNGTEVPHSYDDPLYAVQLQKIDLYMNYIGIPDDMCRQRFLCEVAASPTAYSPLYGVFKKQLSIDSELKKSYYSRFFRYFNAMVEGKRSSVEHSAENDPSAGCRQLYGTCPNNINDTINLDVLRIMQFLTRKFRIQFADTA